MIVELETATPDRFLKRARKPYIHFLKLVPPDDIDIQKLWTSLGYSGQAVDSQKLALTKKLHAAEEEIMHEIEVMPLCTNAWHPLLLAGFGRAHRCGEVECWIGGWQRKQHVIDCVFCIFLMFVRVICGSRDVLHE